MADFSTAILTVLRNEGGWSNDAADAGGETYRGVSRNAHPDWPGWAVIDADRTLEGFPTILDRDPHLQQMVLDLYRTAYWQFDGIGSQEVASKLLDMCVNFGIAGGITECQHALARVIAGPIAVDGIYGPHTMAAINAADPDRLLNELRICSIKRYVKIVLNDQSQEVFLDGWLERAVQ